MEEREEFLLGEENTSPAARTLFVSLDRADAIIDGCPTCRGYTWALRWALMPKNLKRYYGRGDLHFVTFSCYRRLPLLGSSGARNLFVRELARVRGEYGFLLL